MKELVVNMISSFTYLLSQHQGVQSLFTLSDISQRTIIKNGQYSDIYISVRQQNSSNNPNSNQSIIQNVKWSCQYLVMKCPISEKDDRRRIPERSKISHTYFCFSSLRRKNISFLTHLAFVNIEIDKFY